MNAPNATFYERTYLSPLGALRMISDGECLTGLRFEEECGRAALTEMPRETTPLPIFTQTEAWLNLYFRGDIPDVMPRIRFDTTPFRKAVWEILLTIPYGKTLTYGEIARRIAQQRGIAKISAQAVGGAAHHNPIALIIPCHRVIGADGGLVGYAGGLDRKAQLLDLERRNAK